MFTKEPTETLDFSIGWVDWLGSLTIASSAWTGPTGITIVADEFSATDTTVKLGGGTWAEVYELSNTIIASDGQIETRSFYIRIQRSVAYCSSTEVRRRAQGGAGAGGSATTASLTPAELDALIEQASRMFDLECGVPEGYFNPVEIPVATAKTFYGDGGNYLQLPPYLPGTLSISVPADYTIPTYAEQNGYLVLTTESGLLPPFNRFYNLSWPGWWSGVAVTVSAVWGWRETPQDVKAAVIEWVLNLWRETDPAAVKLVGLEGQPLREAIPPRVKAIARKWRGKAAGPAFT
jgi:hypothetical protein